MTLPLRQLEARRRSHYRIGPEHRVGSLAAAGRFIDRMGFCWLFAPSGNIPELPSLFESVKGRRGVHIEDWDADSDRVWGWKNEIAAVRRAYYGKGIMGRPAFASLQMLPPLIAVRGVEDFEATYASGGVSYDARKIYMTLLQSGPMPTATLRLTAGFASKEGSVRYHRALDELQRLLIVMPIGATSQGKAWPIQIIELVARWFPDQVAAARRIDLAEARRTLIVRYLKTVLAAPRSALIRLFGIRGEQADEAIEELTRAKQVRREGEWLIWARR